jgi:hypothetical protein
MEVVVILKDGRRAYVRADKRNEASFIHTKEHQSNSPKGPSRLSSFSRPTNRPVVNADLTLRPYSHCAEMRKQTGSEGLR